MRTVRSVAVLALVAGLILPATTVSARIPAGRLGVGDSIMLSAEGELRSFEVDVRAKVGRQFGQGLARLRSLEINGLLPRRVIVHLGTNGPIDPADCEAVPEVVGPNRQLFLVTVRVPRSWMAKNNATLRSCVEANEHTRLIRWAMVSGWHPEWFADDGYHLNALGQQRYASYVGRQVDAIDRSSESSG
jgi:hypothetical protein